MIWLENVQKMLVQKYRGETNRYKTIKFISMEIFVTENHKSAFMLLMSLWVMEKGEVCQKWTWKYLYILVVAVIIASSVEKTCYKVVIPKISEFSVHRLWIVTCILVCVHVLCLCSCTLFVMLNYILVMLQLKLKPFN